MSQPLCPGCNIASPIRIAITDGGSISLFCSVCGEAFEIYCTRSTLDRNKYQRELMSKRRAVGERLIVAAKEAGAIVRGEAEPAGVYSGWSRGPKKGAGGRPRLGQEGKTQAALKPWLRENPPMSRSTWHRRKKDRGE